MCVCVCEENGNVFSASFTGLAWHLFMRSSSAWHKRDATTAATSQITNRATNNFLTVVAASVAVAAIILCIRHCLFYLKFDVELCVKKSWTTHYLLLLWAVARCVYAMSCIRVVSCCCRRLFCCCCAFKMHLSQLRKQVRKAAHSTVRYPVWAGEDWEGGRAVEAYRSRKWVSSFRLS